MFAAHFCLLCLDILTKWVFFSTLTDDFFFQVPQFMFIFTMKLDSEKSVYLVRL